MNNIVAYQDLIAFHPGTYVADIIEEMNITQAEFAERLGTTPKTVSKIVNAEDSLSKDLANKLSKVTGISLATWLNLQNQYDIKLAQINDLRDREEERIAKETDLKYFKDNKLIPNKKYSLKERIAVLRSLFSVSSLTVLTEFNSSVSYRKVQDFSEKSIVSSNMMLELAIQKAQAKKDIKYQRQRLADILPIIRQLVSQPDPAKFYPELKELLLSCGIVLVALPKLPNARLNGAIKKFKNGSVLLLITDHQKWADIFWFSLLHEIGHLYHEDFKPLSYEDAAYLAKEDAADQFAQDFLIDPKRYQAFLVKEAFSYDDICAFAKEMNLPPGIVVGRLQKEGYLNYNQYNELKIKYEVVLD